MHNVAIDEALQLLGGLILYMSTHGVCLGFLGLYLDITWLQLGIGVLIFCISINVLHIIFGG